MAVADMIYFDELPVPRQRRVFRDRADPLAQFSDADLRRKYRFTRRGLHRLIERIGGELEHDTARSQALPASLQILTALNFFANGAVLDCTATTHGIERITASRCIHRVAQVLESMGPEVIRFPKQRHELEEAKAKFYEIAQFPGVVSAIDGTHICLHGRSLGEDEHVFVNRKGRHSINVQLACTADFKITNVVARFPGRNHDSRILQKSRLGRKFQAGTLKGIMLGDSGYALKSWLLTPVLNPQTNAENAYNRAHCKTRSIIEQVNGQLKNKFRCLIGNGLPFSPERSCRVINACCVLYNLAKEYKEPEEEIEVEIRYDEEEEQDEDERDINGVAARAQIIASFE